MDPNTVTQKTSLFGELISYALADSSGALLKSLIIFGSIFVILIIILVIVIIKSIMTTIKENEYVKIGPLLIKNKASSKKSKLVKSNPDEINPENSSKIIGIQTFMSIIDVVMSVELERIIMNSINASNDINKIESDYDKESEATFNKNFITISNEFHNKFVTAASIKIGFDLERITKTREYFFITDLLSGYKEAWMNQTKEITRRNGFIDFLDDKTKIKPYIEELNDCIFQSIDIKKLESTELTKADLEVVIEEVTCTNYGVLERMFMKLATMKKTMLQKRNDKLEYIDEMIKTAIYNILTNVNDKMLNNSLNAYCDLRDAPTSKK